MNAGAVVTIFTNPPKFIDRLVGVTQQIPRYFDGAAISAARIQATHPQVTIALQVVFKERWQVGTGVLESRHVSTLEPAAV